MAQGAARRCWPTARTTQIKLDEGKLSSRRQRNPADDRHDPAQGGISQHGASALAGRADQRLAAARHAPRRADRPGSGGATGSSRAPIVYVINPDNTVAVRPVKVAQVSGGQALIDSGLTANEQVVVDGQYKLQAGSRVTHPARQGGRGGRGAERAADADPMNISAPFIARPIATALLMVGLLLGGLAAYPLLPIAALPNVNYPTLQVTAQLPGADPQTMASSVATPLETQFGQIPGAHPDDVGERARLHPDHAAVRPEPRDRRRGLRHARPPSTRRARSCRSDMPYPPTIRKVNPADTPILVLGVTSDTLPITTVDAYAENILLQKISQISGVGLVGIGGQQKPAIRIQVDPQALAARGISLEDVRNVIGQANVDLPKGTLNSPRQTYTLNTNDQLLNPGGYNRSDHRLPQRRAGAGQGYRQGDRWAGEQPDRRLVQQASARSSWRSSASPAPTSSTRSTGSRRCCRCCRPRSRPPSRSTSSRTAPRPSARRSATCSSR